MEGSCIGFWKSKANSTFCKVVKQKGEACFCVWKLLFYQQPCAKAQEFCKAEFLDSTSVLALECFFVYGTGGLGLWLGAFGRSRLYRCQSAPGPPMPCFVAQSWAFCGSLPVFALERFGGAGVGVADKPRNVLCSFYVVLTGVWGWLGSQGEPRLCFFFHLFYMLPHQ